MYKKNRETFECAPSTNKDKVNVRIKNINISDHFNHRWKRCKNPTFYHFSSLVVFLTF